MATRTQQSNDEVQASIKHVCMDAQDIDRSINRIAHEILEKNSGSENMVVIGILTRGDVLAHRLVKSIQAIEGKTLPLGSLDISFYRDDVLHHISPEIHSTNIPFSIEDATVILVDDVLYTGRTVRCALDALMDLGRPRCIQFAALVDRGHRELPIRPDYVGKNVPTSDEENVIVLLDESDGSSCVEIVALNKDAHKGALPLQNTTTEQA